MSFPPLWSCAKVNVCTPAGRVTVAVARKPARGTWQYGAEAYSPKDAAGAVPWAARTGHPVARRFRDGRTETWWAADAPLVPVDSRSQATWSRAASAAARNWSFSSGVPIVTRTPSGWNARTITPRLSQAAANGADRPPSGSQTKLA